MLVLACVASCAGPAWAQDAGWLYVVDVPVADQSPGARQQGGRAALAVVLSRLTGQSDVAADPRVRGALASPDRYYNRFGYAAGTMPGETLLRVQFNPPALFDLSRSAGLPIWPSTRPTVRAWLVIDSGAAPHLTAPHPAAADAEVALRVAFAKRALERGLTVRIGAEESAPPVALPPPAVPPAGVAGAPGMPGAAVAAEAGAQGQGGAGQPAAAEQGAVQPSAAATVPDPTAVTRVPDDVMLRPAVLPGDPVWPTLGLWDAAAADIAAMADGRPSELPLVARIGTAPGGGWIARWEVVEAPPPVTVAPEDVVSAVPLADAASAPPDGAQAPDAAPATAAGEVQPAAPVVFEARAATPELLAAALVDGLVDHLLGRYQVQAGASRVVTVAVDGVGSARAYAQVLGLFGDVEVIDDVAVVGAERDRIRFALTTMAALEQVATLVTADGRLVQDPAQSLPGVAPEPVTGGAFIEVLPREPAAPAAAAPVGGSPAAPIEPATGSGAEGEGVVKAAEVPADLVLRWQGS
jgi:hypothetical protein